MARQKLGQHFLIREAVLERIAHAACPEHEPLVVEIGPGRGALTTHLLARADRVVATKSRRRCPVRSDVATFVCAREFSHSLFRGNDKEGKSRVLAPVHSERKEPFPYCGGLAMR